MAIEYYEAPMGFNGVKFCECKICSRAKHMAEKLKKECGFKTIFSYDVNGHIVSFVTHLDGEI